MQLLSIEHIHMDSYATGKCIYTSSYIIGVYTGYLDKDMTETTMLALNAPNKASLRTTIPHRFIW
jgi:hypothetical protein